MSAAVTLTVIGCVNYPRRDPYVRLHYPPSAAAPFAQTTFKKNDPNAKWNEPFTVALVPDEHFVRLACHDWQGIGQDVWVADAVVDTRVLGTQTLHIGDSGAALHVAIAPAQTSNIETRLSNVRHSSSVTNNSSARPGPWGDASGAGGGAPMAMSPSSAQAPLLSKSTLRANLGAVSLTVVSCASFPRKDPFVHVFYPPNAAQPLAATTVKKNDPNPQWNETFTIVGNGVDGSARLVCNDWERGANVFVSEAVVDLTVNGNHTLALPKTNATLVVRVARGAFPVSPTPAPAAGSRASTNTTNTASSSADEDQMQGALHPTRARSPPIPPPPTGLPTKLPSAATPSARTPRELNFSVDEAGIAPHGPTDIPHPNPTTPGRRGLTPIQLPQGQAQSQPLFPPGQASASATPGGGSFASNSAVEVLPPRRAAPASPQARPAATFQAVMAAPVAVPPAPAAISPQPLPPQPVPPLTIPQQPTQTQTHTPPQQQPPQAPPPPLPPQGTVAERRGVAPVAPLGRTEPPSPEASPARERPPTTTILISIGQADMLPGRPTWLLRVCVPATDRYSAKHSVPATASAAVFDDAMAFELVGNDVARADALIELVDTRRGDTPVASALVSLRTAIAAQAGSPAKDLSAELCDTRGNIVGRLALGVTVVRPGVVLPRIPPMSAEQFVPASLKLSRLQQAAYSTLTVVRYVLYQPSSAVSVVAVVSSAGQQPTHSKPAFGVCGSFNHAIQLSLEPASRIAIVTLNTVGGGGAVTNNNNSNAAAAIGSSVNISSLAGQTEFSAYDLIEAGSAWFPLYCRGTEAGAVLLRWETVWFNHVSGGGGGGGASPGGSGVAAAAASAFATPARRWSHVRLEVVEATDLPTADVGGSCDAYCVVQTLPLGPEQQSCSTLVARDTGHPSWGQVFDIPLRPRDAAGLVFTVLDRDGVGEDNFVGVFVMRSDSALWTAQAGEAWFPLTSRDDGGAPPAAPTRQSRHGGSYAPAGNGLLRVRWEFSGATAGTGAGGGGGGAHATQGQSAPSVLASLVESTDVHLRVSSLRTTGLAMLNPSQLCRAAVEMRCGAGGGTMTRALSTAVATPSQAPVFSDVLLQPVHGARMLRLEFRVIATELGRRDIIGHALVDLSHCARMSGEETVDLVPLVLPDGGGLCPPQDVLSRCPTLGRLSFAWELTPGAPSDPSLLPGGGGAGSLVVVGQAASDHQQQALQHKPPLPAQWSVPSGPNDSLLRLSVLQTRGLADPGSSASAKPSAGGGKPPSGNAKLPPQQQAAVPPVATEIVVVWAGGQHQHREPIAPPLGSVAGNSVASAATSAATARPPSTIECRLVPGQPALVEFAAINPVAGTIAIGQLDATVLAARKGRTWVTMRGPPAAGGGNSNNSAVGGQDKFGSAVGSIEVAYEHTLRLAAAVAGDGSSANACSVTIGVLQARELLPRGSSTTEGAAGGARSNGVCEAVVVVGLGSTRQVTAVAPPTINPVFGDTFDFTVPVASLLTESLRLQVIDRAGGNDTVIGGATIALTDIVGTWGTPRMRWITLQEPADSLTTPGGCGEVLISGAAIGLELIPEALQAMTRSNAAADDSAVTRVAAAATDGSVLAVKIGELGGLAVPNVDTYVKAVWRGDARCTRVVPATPTPFFGETLTFRVAPTSARGEAGGPSAAVGSLAQALFLYVYDATTQSLLGSARVGLPREGASSEPAAAASLASGLRLPLVNVSETGAPCPRLAATLERQRAVNAGTLELACRVLSLEAAAAARAAGLRGSTVCASISAVMLRGLSGSAVAGAAATSGAPSSGAFGMGPGVFGEAVRLRLRVTPLVGTEPTYSYATAPTTQAANFVFGGDDGTLAGVNLSNPSVLGVEVLVGSSVRFAGSATVKFTSATETQEVWVDCLAPTTGKRDSDNSNSVPVRALMVVHSEMKPAVTQEVRRAQVEVSDFSWLGDGAADRQQDDDNAGPANGTTVAVLAAAANRRVAPVSVTLVCGNTRSLPVAVAPLHAGSGATAPAVAMLSLPGVAKVAVRVEVAGSTGGSVIAVGSAVLVADGRPHRRVVRLQSAARDDDGARHVAQLQISYAVASGSLGSAHSPESGGSAQNTGRESAATVPPRYRYVVEALKIRNSPQSTASIPGARGGLRCAIASAATSVVVARSAPRTVYPHWFCCRALFEVQPGPLRFLVEAAPTAAMAAVPLGEADLSGGGDGGAVVTATFRTQPLQRWVPLRLHGMPTGQDLLVSTYRERDTSARGGHASSATGGETGGGTAVNVAAPASQAGVALSLVIEVPEALSLVAPSRDEEGLCDAYTVITCSTLSGAFVMRRTEVAPRSLQPRWNTHRFALPFDPNDPPRMIRALVFHKDEGDEDDCLGGTAIDIGEAGASGDEWAELQPRAPTGSAAAASRGSGNDATGEVGSCGQLHIVWRVQWVPTATIPNSGGNATAGFSHSGALGQVASNNTIKHQSQPSAASALNIPTKGKVLQIEVLEARGVPPLPADGEGGAAVSKRNQVVFPRLFARLDVGSGSESQSFATAPAASAGATQKFTSTNYQNGGRCIFFFPLPPGATSATPLSVSLWCRDNVSSGVAFFGEARVPDAAALVHRCATSGTPAQQQQQQQAKSKTSSGAQWLPLGCRPGNARDAARFGGADVSLGEVLVAASVADAKALHAAMSGGGGNAAVLAAPSPSVPTTDRNGGVSTGGAVSFAATTAPSTFSPNDAIAGGRAGAWTMAFSLQDVRMTDPSTPLPLPTTLQLSLPPFVASVVLSHLGAGGSGGGADTRWSAEVLVLGPIAPGPEDEATVLMQLNPPPGALSALPRDMDDHSGGTNNAFGRFRLSSLDEVGSVRVPLRCDHSGVPTTVAVCTFAYVVGGWWPGLGGRRPPQQLRQRPQHQDSTGADGAANAGSVSRNNNDNTNNAPPDNNGGSPPALSAAIPSVPGLLIERVRFALAAGASEPDPTAGHTLTACPNPRGARFGMIAVRIGGARAGGGGLYDSGVHDLDTPSGKWRSTRDTPGVAREGHTAVYRASTGDIIVYGGVGPGGLDEGLAALAGEYRAPDATYEVGSGGAAGVVELSPRRSRPQTAADGSGVANPALGGPSSASYGVAGAAAHSVGYFDSTMLYNTATRQWAAQPTSGDGKQYRADHTAVMVSGERMLVFGGWGIAIVETTLRGGSGLPVAVFDHSRPPGSAASSGLAHQSRHRLLLRYTTRQFRRDDLAVLDAASGRWTAVTAVGARPPPLTGHSANLVDNVEGGQTMIVYGGAEGTSGALNPNLYFLDISRCEWKRIQTDPSVSPPAREGHSTAVYGNKLLVVGGRVEGTGDPSGAGVWQFDPVSGVWATVRYAADATPLRPRFAAACVATMRPSVSDPPQLVLHVVGGVVGGTVTALNGDGDHSFHNPHFSSDASLTLGFSAITAVPGGPSGVALGAPASGLSLPPSGDHPCRVPLSLSSQFCGRLMEVTMSTLHDPAAAAAQAASREVRLRESVRRFAAARPVRVPTPEPRFLHVQPAKVVIPPPELDKMISRLTSVAPSRRLQEILRANEKEERALVAGSHTVLPTAAIEDRFRRLAEDDVRRRGQRAEEEKAHAAEEWRKRHQRPSLNRISRDPRVREAEAKRHAQRQGAIRECGDSKSARSPTSARQEK